VFAAYRNVQQTLLVAQAIDGLVEADVVGEYPTLHLGGIKRTQRPGIFARICVAAGFKLEGRDRSEAVFAEFDQSGAVGGVGIADADADIARRIVEIGVAKAVDGLHFMRRNRAGERAVADIQQQAVKSPLVERKIGQESSDKFHRFCDTIRLSGWIQPLIRT